MIFNLDSWAKVINSIKKSIDDVKTEVIPIKRGGTGGTTVKEAEYNLFSEMEEITTDDRNDNSLIAGVYGSPSETRGKLFCFKLSLLWNYIKSKADSLYAPKTQLGGCYLKYEDGKFYVGYDDGTNETEV